MKLTGFQIEKLRLDNMPGLIILSFLHIYFLIKTVSPVGMGELPLFLTSFAIQLAL